MQKKNMLDVVICLSLLVVTVPKAISAVSYASLEESQGQICAQS